MTFIILTSNIKKSKKGKKRMRKQDDLRKKVKLAKACNDWLYYKELAETLEMADHSFYNWLNEEDLVEEKIPENTGFSNDYLPE